MAIMRAKMQVTEVLRQAGSEVLKMRAVPKSEGYSDDGTDENNTYAMFTPQAEVGMLIQNPALFGAFDPGQELYVDFSEVPQTNVCENEENEETE